MSVWQHAPELSPAASALNTRVPCNHYSRHGNTMETPMKHTSAQIPDCHVRTGVFYCTCKAFHSARHRALHYGQEANPFQASSPAVRRRHSYRRTVLNNTRILSVGKFSTLHLFPVCAHSEVRGQLQSWFSPPPTVWIWRIKLSQWAWQQMTLPSEPSVCFVYFVFQVI